MKPVPFRAALDRLESKTAVASSADSAQWAATDAGLRDRAFFTARMEHLGTVQTMKDKITTALNLNQGNPDAPAMDRSRFVRDMRAILGKTPDSKKITDITSNRRLSLIYNFQTEDARSYGKWSMDQDPDLLDEFPAQELLRVEDREAPRDWAKIWQAEGGVLRRGRMVALKDDPIWTAISRFGRPWPPFDYGSGMGLEDMDRAEAESLGLLKPGQVVPPTKKDFNDKLEAGTASLDEEAKATLKEQFGEQIIIQDKKVQWVGPAKALEEAYRKVQTGELEPGANTPLDLGIISAPLRKNFEDLGIALNARATYTVGLSDVNHVNNRHGQGETQKGHVPISPEHMRHALFVLDHPEEVKFDAAQGGYIFSRFIPGLGKLHVVAKNQGPRSLEIITIYAHKGKKL